MINFWKLAYKSVKEQRDQHKVELQQCKSERHHYKTELESYKTNLKQRKEALEFNRDEVKKYKAERDTLIDDVAILKANNDRLIRRNQKLEDYVRMWEKLTKWKQGKLAERCNNDLLRDLSDKMNRLERDMYKERE